jgi:hypothetical protein
VFLAIAVDNLANAHVLTEDEKDERLEREARNEHTEGNERTASHWKDLGQVTKTLALVKSWTSSANPSPEESNGDATSDGVNG